MENKNLQKKLEKVCVHIFSFFLCYLIIAFFLKSKYPIYNYTFNREAAYDVLRDGLTLSAYFLAPAVAFVLFNDWKDEHRIKSNEKLSMEIKLSLYRAYILIASYGSIDKFEIVTRHEYEFEKYLFQIRKLNEDIYSFDEDSTRFKSDTEELLGLLENGRISWKELVSNRISVSIRNKNNDVQLSPDSNLCDKYSNGNIEILLKLNQFTVLKV